MENKELKILAIDDNRDNLITIHALVMEAFPDAIVHTALSGVEGIELAAKTDPDVILLDVVMPGMDGFEVCGKLKEDPVLCDIPVVFVTALKGDKESRIRGLEVGAEAFLAKPIDESELVAQVRAMVKIKVANVSRRDENFRLAALVAERTRELKQTHIATLNLLEDLRKENEARRKTEDELRESEARLRRAELASKSGNWELLLDEKIIVASVGATSVYGIDKAVMSYDDVKKVPLPEYRPLLDRSMQALIEKDEPYNIEFKICKVDTGEIVDVHSIASYDKDKRRIFGVIRDITQKKQTEEALRESEALYRAILDSTPDNITITDVNGNAIMVSKSTLKTYGFEKEEDALGCNVLSYIVNEDQERLSNDFGLMMQGIQTGPNEYKSVKNDGSVFDIEVKGGIIRNLDGDIEKLAFVARDVTERKKADNKIKQSEIEFRTVWENSANGLRLTDERGNIIRVNDAFCKIFEKTKEEIEGKTIAEIYLPEKRAENLAKHIDRFKRREVERHLEKELELWNGKKKWVQVDNSFLEIEGQQSLLLGIFTDITERANAEGKVRHLTRLYALLGQINQAIVRTSHTEKLLQKICDVAIEFGQFRMAWIGRYNAEEQSIRFLHSSGYEDGYLDAISGVLSDVGNSNGPTSLAIRQRSLVCCKNVGTDPLMYKWRDEALKRGYLSLAVIPIYRQNKIYGTLNLYASEIDFFDEDEQKLLLEIGEDISYALQAIDAESERKKIEEALEQSRLELKTIYDSAPVMMCVVDDERRIIFANTAFSTFTRTPEEKLRNGKACGVFGCINAMDDPRGCGFGKTCTSCKLRKAMEDTMKTGVEHRNVEYNTTLLTGEEHRQVSLLGSTALIHTGGEKRLLLCLHDMTTRKEAEEALRQNNERLELAMGVANMAWWEMDVSTGNVWFEKRKAEMLGFSPDKFTHFEDFMALVHVDDKEKAMDAMRNHYRNKAEKYQVEYRIRNSAGDYKCFYDIGSISKRDDSGKPLVISGLVLDITERKVAEEALQKSEMFLRTFIDNTPFQIWARDVNNVGILENKMLIEMFGSILGRTPDDEKDKDPRVIQLWKKNNKRVFKGEIVDEEIDYKKDDKVLYFQQLIFPIYLNKEIIGIAGFNIDITERKLAQEALRESQLQLKNFAAHLQNVREEERVLLAREIHDDLGQILVAIKIDLGMLSHKVQKTVEQTGNEELMLKFEQLYGLVDNTIKTARRIMTDLRPEVLDLLGLIDAIKQHLAKFEERYNVRCVFENEIADIELTSQQSVALFRILQESLNNIAKHARANTVKVFLGMVNDKLCFQISDDGVGFDTRVRARLDSYGLIGMKERAFLLDGELTVKSKPGKGTVVTIEMPY
jgi:PAS domain S-box-containing protein